MYRDAFKIGCAINPFVVMGIGKSARDIVIRQFNTTTSENVIKAGPINPRPGIFNFEPADKYVEFAEKNHMFIVGRIQEISGSLFKGLA